MKSSGELEQNKPWGRDQLGLGRTRFMKLEKGVSNDCHLCVKKNCDPSVWTHNMQQPHLDLGPRAQQWMDLQLAHLPSPTLSSKMLPEVGWTKTGLVPVLFPWKGIVFLWGGQKHPAAKNIYIYYIKPPSWKVSNISQWGPGGEKKLPAYFKMLQILFRYPQFNRMLKLSTLQALNIYGGSKSPLICGHIPSHRGCSCACPSNRRSVSSRRKLRWVVAPNWCQLPGARVTYG